MTHLVDQETIREIIETVVDAVDQRRKREEKLRAAAEHKWIGSAPAWLSLFISVGVGIFMLGSLVGDVAIAKTDSFDAKKAIQTMQIEQAELKRDIAYLVEAEKKRSGVSQ